MAWTAPMTAVANTAFTAAQFNTHVRDNLLETMPGKATAGFPNGSIAVKSATNQISMRTPLVVSVDTQQSSSSTSYTNLSTVGPTITCTTGASAIVFWSGSMLNSGTNSTLMSIGVSGATTFTADDNKAIRHRDGTGSNGEEALSMSYMFTTLNAGSNTFQAKYRVIGGTGTWQYRRLIVFPL